jgi:hypothetical protein
VADPPGPLPCHVGAVRVAIDRQRHRPTGSPSRTSVLATSYGPALPRRELVGLLPPVGPYTPRGRWPKRTCSCLPSSSRRDGESTAGQCVGACYVHALARDRKIIRVHRFCHQLAQVFLVGHLFFSVGVECAIFVISVCKVLSQLSVWYSAVFLGTSTQSFRSWTSQLLYLLLWLILGQWSNILKEI